MRRAELLRRRAQVRAEFTCPVGKVSGFPNLAQSGTIVVQQSVGKVSVYLVVVLGLTLTEEPERAPTMLSILRLLAPVVDQLSVTD